MALLLHIDTALEVASVALSADEQCVGSLTNAIQNDHAAWLHTAIDELLKKYNYAMCDLDAVSVTTGPGSYTGLRVGLSTAKGICYALQKPLLTVSSLQLLASVAKEAYAATEDVGSAMPPVRSSNTTSLAQVEAFSDATMLICPMIDARRMEVYYALYDQTLRELSAPAALILDETSFTDILSSKKIIFCGNGIEKFKKVCPHNHAIFSEAIAGAREMATLAFKKYVKKEFADL
ncbi:MAG: tRNA (adenosine(37)-N6)-threonylcarbamoyltransferase complex dimerization subunit type 1 TsaB, partial [Chitinophagia bacterium]|nr:tRNA (adenosine(37)-N6)-threonylcarbamoyltransferase complex dimerization subunit type 1 TsaB [Chitinophagia bacterium]